MPLLAFLALAPLVRAQNIIVNSSYETWLDTIGVKMPVGWLTSAITDSTSAVMSPDAHTGNYSIRLMTTDTAGYAVTAGTAIVSPGTVYDFSAYAKTSSTLGGSFFVTWLNLSGDVIGAPAAIPVYISSGYRQYTSHLTAPDSAVFCVIAFATNLLQRGTTVYVDDVTLTAQTSGTAGSYPATPRRFRLYPAVPNPFSSASQISYSLSMSAVAKLKVYNLVGNEVRTLVDDYRPAGFYTTYWNAANDAGEPVPPGVYFCRLEVGDQPLTQKLMLLGE
jgi:hypothetical protein